MNTFEYIEHLQHQGVGLSIKGSQLKCSIPLGETLSPAVKKEIKKRKSDIFDFLTQSRNFSQPAGFQIHPCPPQITAPLSFSQEKLWYLQKVSAHPGYYNTSLAWRIAGHPDIELLESCFTEIVRRNESYRMAYRSENCQIRQAISPAKTIKINTIDLSTTLLSERDHLINAHISQLAWQPFDLEHDQLFRSHSLIFSDEYLLLISTHQILYDGTSINLLIHEINQIYKALALKRELPPPLAERKYTDFAYCLRKWFKGDIKESNKEYWHQQLERPYKLLPLTYDKPIENRSVFKSKIKTFSLTADTTHDLRMFSRENGITLYLLLFTVLNLLIHSYTKCDDIILFTFTSLRNKPGLRNIIGLFTNILVSRTDLGGDPTCLDLTKRADRVIRNGMKHQYFPFAEQLEILNVENGKNRPIFQVLYVYINEEEKYLQLADKECQPVHVDRTTDFDIIINTIEKQDLLEVSFEYKKDLYHDWTITRIFNDFSILLKAFVDNPQQPISYHSSQIYSPFRHTYSASAVAQASSVTESPVQTSALLCPWESKLAAILCKILKTNLITPDDIFGDLSPHSLTVVKAAVSVEHQLKIRIPLQDFFLKTLKEIAKACQKGEYEQIN